MYEKNKILDTFLQNPGKAFHIRLLARMTGMHPNTVINKVDDLVKKGLLLKAKDKELNIVQVRGNEQDKMFKIRKKFYNIEKIMTSGLLDFLEKEFVHPTIILFGSYAKAENHEGSDVDLFVITENKKKVDVSEYEKKLSAELQLFTHTKKEFRKLKTTSPELINNVINGYRLSGFLEVL